MPLDVTTEGIPFTCPDLHSLDRQPPVIFRTERTDVPEHESLGADQSIFARRRRLYHFTCDRSPVEKYRHQDL